MYSVEGMSSGEERDLHHLLYDLDHTLSTPNPPSPSPTKKIKYKQIWTVQVAGCSLKLKDWKYNCVFFPRTP